MKKILAVLMVAFLSAPTIGADDIKKGQKAWIKTCKKCHGNGTKGAAMHSQDEWEEIFEEDGALFIELHEGTKAEKFAKGKKFQKLSPYLKAFLMEYANDTGKVPSCG